MNQLIENPNRIKQHSSCCVYCGKSYKTRSGLEKHVILCEITYKANHGKKSVSEEDDELEIPSQKKMYQIILELGLKCKRLEEKVEEVSKWVVKKKKKINVLEWLTANIQPTILFVNLSEMVVIIESDIEYLLKNTFIDTLNEIFMRSLFQTNQYGESDEQITNSNPIFAFSQKQNMFYIYDKKENTEVLETGWIELSREKLITFLNIVHRKISKALSEWKKQNNEKIKSCDSTCILYDKTMVKLMDVNFKHEPTFSKIKSFMYNKMKIDMKALIEYEFEF